MPTTLSSVPDAASVRDARTVFPQAHSISARGGIPRLLVSVRNGAEAVAARDAGADVIDLKEPAGGSLGMAPLPVIREIVSQLHDRIPVTAALGETSDWLDAQEFPALPTDLACVKLGLAGLRDRHAWKSDWADIRARFDAAAGVHLGWVAVIYADADIADSPPAEAVVEAAAQSGCRGVLIDTFSKSSGSLLTRVGIDQLETWTARVHAAGLFMALAGRVSADDLPLLSRVPADIIAVRSAVCLAGRRDARIAAERIAAFKQHLANEYSHAEDRGDRRRWARAT